MTAQTLEKERPSQICQIQYLSQIKSQVEETYYQFKHILRSYTFFHLFFLVLFSAEIVLFFLQMMMAPKSVYFVLGLAAILLTLFSFFILRIYFHTQKMEQLEELKDHYLEACKEVIGYRYGKVDSHVGLAQACCKFSSYLQGKEYVIYKLSNQLALMIPWFEKLNCWWHWEDILIMQELLLLASVDEHIKMVKCDPTSLEIHAALANAYVIFSSLYVDPRKNTDYDSDRWISKERYSHQAEDKFRVASQKAVEEFKVLSDFAPDDPWVHMQLAHSYSDLRMPQEEIQQYEILLGLTPEDPEIIFKLGRSYFKQGQNSKGLKLYEKLKDTSYKKAESLIKYYGEHA